MSPLSAPVLVVRTPEGDTWPTKTIMVFHDDAGPDVIVSPQPPSGSALFRSQYQVVGGAYMEVEMKVCDV